jgi:hypothetical protein
MNDIILPEPEKQQRGQLSVAREFQSLQNFNPSRVTSLAAEFQSLQRDVIRYRIPIAPE